MLDDGRYGEWLSLFTEDALYWVPCNDMQNTPEDHVAIIYDSKDALGQRVTRLEHGRLVQDPPSRTLHTISNIMVEPATGDAEVEVRAALVLYVEHAGKSGIHPARCRYRLRREGGSWRIVEKTVSLLGNDNFLPNIVSLL